LFDPIETFAEETYIAGAPWAVTVSILPLARRIVVVGNIGLARTRFEEPGVRG